MRPKRIRPEHGDDVRPGATIEGGQLFTARQGQYLAVIYVLRPESAGPDVRQALGAVVNREDVYLVFADLAIDDAIRPFDDSRTAPRSNSGTTRPDCGKSLKRATARMRRATTTEA